MPPQKRASRPNFLSRDPFAEREGYYNGVLQTPHGEVDVFGNAKGTTFWLLIDSKLRSFRFEPGLTVEEVKTRAKALAKAHLKVKP